MIDQKIIESRNKIITSLNHLPYVKFGMPELGIKDDIDMVQFSYDEIKDCEYKFPRVIIGILKKDPKKSVIMHYYKCSHCGCGKIHCQSYYTEDSGVNLAKGPEVF